MQCYYDVFPCIWWSFLPFLVLDVRMEGRVLMVSSLTSVPVLQITKENTANVCNSIYHSRTCFESIIIYQHKIPSKVIQSKIKQQVFWLEHDIYSCRLNVTLSPLPVFTFTIILKISSKVTEIYNVLFCSIVFDDTDNPCELNPCIHGNCVDLVSDYRCDCFPGYGGRICSGNF